MKKRTIQAKKILKSLINYKTDIDSRFDINKLRENNCLYFQMEDYYGFTKDKRANGELKQKTIEVLLNIFHDWQNNLEGLGFNYYLAIWLYNPRISLSEVVCGINNTIEYYENDVFLQNDKKINFNSLNFGKLDEELKKLTWDLKIDLDNVSDWEVNYPKEQYKNLKEYNVEQRYHKKNIKNAIKTIEEPSGNLYLFPAGDVWVGQFKSKK
ncbi:hypothetical protein [Lacihabitans sp. CS3-21]|uniref:hypothetical protein n=1 Tax=Lacihabitans sp. CS3-21 TaxID=2487332 RepID=UPI0020CC0548|nr:hypothetical protein [Lacihabitans sp. CS3-21]